MTFIGMAKIEKKTCSKCKKDKDINEFRGENKSCNYCCESRRLYRINNYEKIKEYEKEYRQSSYICSLCKFEVKQCRKTSHERSVGHQYYLQQFNKNEEPRKPDKIEIIDGIPMYCCFSCRSIVPQNVWGSHCVYDLEKLEKQNKT